MKENYDKFDIVLVDFGENCIGAEQKHIRPSIIIQNSTGNKYSSSTIVMPFTSRIKKLDQPTHSLFIPSKENGLEQRSMLLGECIRQISEDRIIRKLGTIYNNDERMKVKRVYEANWG